MQMLLMMISLGCDKNLVDTEMMLGQLKEAGFTFTDEQQEAEVIVVNTCCFIGDAKEESINTLIEMGRLKQEGRLKCLIAAGCLAQRYQEEIRRELPEVDALVGTMAIDRIVAAVKETLEHTQEKESGGASQAGMYLESIDRLVCGKKRIVSTGGHFAYLKIAEGCDKNCTYCVIPKVRGRYRSVPMETLLREARDLADQGVKELILIAQETTLYGTDLYGEKSLPGLIHELAQISGIEWIRLLYCYPEEVTPELAETFATEKKLLHYIDLPIQHSSDEILRRMGRHTTAAGLAEKMLFARTDGLTGLDPASADTVVIAGMGGETIAAILSAAAPGWRKGHRFILQPMTKAPELLRALAPLGLALTEDRLVKEGETVYRVLAAGEGTMPALTPLELELGPSRPEDPVYAEALKRLVRRLEKARKGLSGAKNADPGRLAETEALLREAKERS